jgi:GntR family transcriptional repressor for pyruvate dehydrogenase complex
MLSLDPITRTTVTEQVIKSLVSLVCEGTLKPGDKLPSEQQLMEQLHVGRTSLREALRTLSLVGLLEARRGSGTYVTKSFSDYLADQLEWSAVLGETDLFELVEVRRPLEVQAAISAALRSSEQDLLRLRKALERFETCDEHDEEGRIEADLEFHLELARASGNKVLYRLMSSLDTLMRRFMRETTSATVRFPDTTIKEHRSVLEAISVQNPAQAAHAMEGHLNSSYKEFLALLSKPYRQVKEAEEISR